MFWIEQFVCLKWNLFWHISSAWKMQAFGWLLHLGSEPKNYFYCCCYVRCMPWACLWVCAGNLPPLAPGGYPGLGYHTLGVKRRAPVFSPPFPPHKSYFLTYLAPIARVSEAILRFWRISSPTPLQSKAGPPLPLWEGPRHLCSHLVFLGSDVGQASAKQTRFTLNVSVAQGIA